MAQIIARRSYVEPALLKRERLSCVTAQSSTISGQSLPKGGCFESKPEYQEPALKKREKLSDVSDATTSVSGAPIPG